MASKVLRKLQKLGEASGPGSQMAYLRSKAVDPFVFEEAILTALRERGLRIRRNKRYTGDGGIDGNAWIGKQRVLIQAKLYTNHIAPADVREFARLCQRHRAMGLFVHSGRTGPASRKQLTDELDIVSGERLLQLLCGDPLRLFPQRTPSDAKRKGRQ